MRCIPFALAVAAWLGTAAAGQDLKKPDPSRTDDPAQKDDPPVHEVSGKTFDQWVREIHAKDPSRREAAIRTVVLFGPEKASKAVPEILFELKRHTPTTPVDTSVRVNGTLALGAILGDARDPDPKHCKDAVAILRGFLKDTQSIVRYRAAQALPRLGPEARAALPEVLTMVRDPETWETRQAALQALVVLAADAQGPPSPTMLNALTKALADPSHQVRFAALQAMAVVGTPGEVSAKTGMIRTLEGVATKDVDPSVQLWAHMALMTVKQAITNDHLLPIAKMLRHDDPAVRTQAAQALAMAGPQAKATVGTVAAALNDPDPVVVGNCIIALTRMEASSAVPALRKLANDPTQNDALKKAAADAIEQIQGAGKEKKK